MLIYIVCTFGLFIILTGALGLGCLAAWPSFSLSVVFRWLMYVRRCKIKSVSYEAPYLTLTLSNPKITGEF